MGEGKSQREQGHEGDPLSPVRHSHASQQKGRGEWDGHGTGCPELLHHH